MASLIETSLWIDFTRAKSPKALKRFIAPYILDPEACVAEPVVFEVLRHATPTELQPLREQFATMPMLGTPPDVWEVAADLGRRCRQKNEVMGSLDLLIAAVALGHDAEVVTFDVNYEKIAAVSGLRVKRLVRP